MRKIYAAVLLLLTLSACTKSESVVPQGNQLSSLKVPARFPVVVILGSSTASGVGASDYKHAWAGLFSTYLSNGKVVNLAKGGYTTYQILASNISHPANRPEADTARNITAALKLRPTFLIISMTTNDIANGHSVDEVIANLNAVRSMALANGVRRFIITTPHPRRISVAITKKYMEQRDQVIKMFGTEAVNFFDPVADSMNEFRADLLSSDGLHPNDKGHAVLFSQIKSAFERNL